jgi:hypothetical protein
MKNGLRIVLIGAGSREFSRAVIHDLVLECSPPRASARSATRL